MTDEEAVALHNKIESMWRKSNALSREIMVKQSELKRNCPHPVVYRHHDIGVPYCSGNWDCKLCGKENVPPPVKKEQA